MEIDKIVEDILKSAAATYGCDCAIGREIAVSDTVSIVPVSRVTVAAFCGLGEEKIKKKNKSQTLGGGNDGGGAACSVRPMGFLIFKGTDSRYVECKSGNENDFETLIAKCINSIIGAKR